MKTKKSILFLLIGMIMMFTAGTLSVSAATSEWIKTDRLYVMEPNGAYDDTRFIYFNLDKPATVEINVYAIEGQYNYSWMDEEAGNVKVFLDPVSESNVGNTLMYYSDGWYTKNCVAVTLKKGTHRLLVNSDWVKNYSVYIHTKKVHTEGPATQIKLAKSKTITKGLQASLKPELVYNYETLTEMKWTTSKKSVATVSSTGVVTAKKAGTATITCTLKNGKKYTCKVTVKDNVYKGRTYSKLNARNYDYGQVWLEPLKISYSGKKLRVECAALNARIFKAKKFSWINFTVHDGDGKVIAKHKFKNVSLNIKGYGKKKVTFTFPANKVKKKNHDLRLDNQMYISYDYWYIYQY